MAEEEVLDAMTEMNTEMATLRSDCPDENKARAGERLVGWCELLRDDYHVAWATVEMLQSALTEQREKTLGRVGDIVLPEARKLILP